VASVAVDDLRRGLGSHDSGQRRQAAYALARLGPQAAPAVGELSDALADSDSLVRMAAARALGAVGGAAEPAVPRLEALVRGEEPLIQVEIAFALCRIDGVTTSRLGVLRQGLLAPEAAARRHAARTLGELGPAAAEAASDLELATRDPVAAVAEAAAAALAAVRPR
jgi:HEAT repeat protein